MTSLGARTLNPADTLKRLAGCEPRCRVRVREIGQHNDGWRRYILAHNGEEICIAYPPLATPANVLAGLGQQIRELADHVRPSSDT